MLDLGEALPALGRLQSVQTQAGLHARIGEPDRATHADDPLRLKSEKQFKGREVLGPQVPLPWGLLCVTLAVAFEAQPEGGQRLGDFIARGLCLGAQLQVAAGQQAAGLRQFFSLAPNSLR